MMCLFIFHMVSLGPSDLRKTKNNYIKVNKEKLRTSNKL